MQETDIDDRYGDLDSRTDSDIPEIPPSSDRTPEILKKALSGLSSRCSQDACHAPGVALALGSGTNAPGQSGEGATPITPLLLPLPAAAAGPRPSLLSAGSAPFPLKEQLWDQDRTAPLPLPLRKEPQRWTGLSPRRCLSLHRQPSALTAANLLFSLTVPGLTGPRWAVLAEDLSRVASDGGSASHCSLEWPDVRDGSLSGHSFCMFVLSLVKKHYRLQFYMFAWTHVTLLITVTQSHLVIQNLFEGMIWFLVPISSVICNDITAYLFGFFFGRTPLIKLSPKKTWEGFIGGFFSTVVFGFICFVNSCFVIQAAYVLSKYQYFVCPVEYRSDVNSFVTECEPSELFQLQSYSLPSLSKGSAETGKINERVSLYPFQIHSIALSTFASLIGPFGGFFASGFKRAFKIKDFANTIPGHGGIMDRFDCQYLMATFVHVYITSFIRGPNPSKVLQQLLVLQPEQQLNIYKTLKMHLIEKGILQPTLK
ncbi:hypothetical protein QTO34_008230, partial [Cnephaeus nilssonii]